MTERTNARRRVPEGVVKHLFYVIAVHPSQELFSLRLCQYYIPVLHKFRIQYTARLSLGTHLNEFSGWGRKINCNDGGG